MADNTPLKLEVTQEQIKNFVAEAVLQQLDETTKQEMITSALKYLVTNPKKERSWGADIPSPLEEAYNRAVSLAAQEIVSALVKGEFKDRIEGVCREALEKVFVENRENLVDGVVHSMQRAMYDLRNKG